MATLHVSKSKTLGILRFWSDHPEWDAPPFLDRFDSLKRQESFQDLLAFCNAHGIEFDIPDDAKEQWALLERITTNRFEVDSPFLKDKELRPYQHVGMNLAMELPNVLLRWGVGAGKTVAGALVAQKLIDNGDIDIVLVFCEKPMRRQWQIFFEENTYLSVVRPDGTRERRQRYYEESGAQVFILNYEKARTYQTKNGKKNWDKTDILFLNKLTKGKNVLFITDETQKLGAETLHYRGIISLAKTNIKAGGTNRLIDLTATPYKSSPMNFYWIFHRLVPGLLEPTLGAFKKEYVKEYRYFETRNGALIPTPKTWHKLPKLGKRTSVYMHEADKNDPLIADQFPSQVIIPDYVDISDKHLPMYNYVAAEMYEALDTAEMHEIRQYNDVLKIICNSPEGLPQSTMDYAHQIHQRFGGRTEDNAKFQSLCERLDTIFDADEKMVLFSFYRNITIPHYHRALKKRFKDVPMWVFSGGKGGELERDRKREEFNNHDGPGLFISSDAGKAGINLYASYLTHIELPGTHYVFEQRNGRISRQDSKEHGIDKNVIYYYVTQGTVEVNREEKVFLHHKKQEEKLYNQEEELEEERALTRADYKKMLEESLQKRNSRKVPQKV